MDNVMQRAAAKRVVIFAAAAALVLVVLVVVRPPGVGAAPAAPTQTTRRGTSTTTTSAPASTEPAFTTSVPAGGTAPNGGPLLVPGASDAPAQTTVGSTDSDNTGTIVALVITGLLVVALLLGLLTYWYWRNTRPVKVHEEASPDELAEAKVKDG